MEKVYLINNIRKNYENITREEFIPLFQNDKILLVCKKNNNQCIIYRKEKISLLEDKVSEMEITEEEYVELVENKQRDNVPLGIIKDIYTYKNGNRIEKYIGAYEGIIKLIVCDNNQIEIGDELIDITEKDISRDNRLINITQQEFAFELTQIKLENE